MRCRLMDCFLARQERGFATNGIGSPFQPWDYLRSQGLVCALLWSPGLACWAVPLAFVDLSGSICGLLRMTPASRTSLQTSLTRYLDLLLSAICSNLP
jgi:hypothetical protein